MTGKLLPEFLKLRNIVSKQYKKILKNIKETTILQGSSTKLMNQINNCLKNEEVSFITLEELIDQLNIKLDQLKEKDDKIKHLIKLDVYDEEIEPEREYNKISLNLFHARKKIRENDDKKIVENTDNSGQISAPYF